MHSQRLAWHSTFALFAGGFLMSLLVSSVGQPPASPAVGFRVRLLPFCLPPPPPVDIYGFDPFLIVEMEAGTVKLNGKVMAGNMLVNVLHQIDQTRANKLLFLLPDQQEPYQNVIRVLDEIQPLGDRRIILLTKRTGEEFEAGIRSKDCWFHF